MSANKLSESKTTGEMHQILVYGDSLSWGIIPGTRNRLEFTKRWPGVMECQLHQLGHDVRVIEDCLNGRRTSWDDPVKPGRNGRIGLEQRVEMHSPLVLVILFLGTNDFQTVHPVDAAQSAEGIASLIRAIRCSPIEPGMPIPEVLVVAPPAIQPSAGPMAAKFANAETKSKGLSAAIKTITMESNCHFFDAENAVQASHIDGVHLDEDQHSVLGIELAGEVEIVLHTPDR